MDYKVFTTELAGRQLSVEFGGIMIRVEQDQVEAAIFEAGDEFVRRGGRQEERLAGACASPFHGKPRQHGGYFRIFCVDEVLAIKAHGI